MNSNPQPVFDGLDDIVGWKDILGSKDGSADIDGLDDIVGDPEGNAVGDADGSSKIRRPPLRCSYGCKVPAGILVTLLVR